jgi:hypothetical protein
VLDPRGEHDPTHPARWSVPFGPAVDEACGLLTADGFYVVPAG